jgi:hypothetical protein
LYSKQIIGEVAKAKVSHMSYQNFDDHITSKFSVIIENWPLKTFCSPSDVKSLNKVKVLYHAWDSGAVHFCRLSTKEWKDWEENRFRKAMTQMDSSSETRCNEPAGHHNDSCAEHDDGTAVNCGDSHAEHDNIPIDPNLLTSSTTSIDPHLSPSLNEILT